LIISKQEFLVLVRNLQKLSKSHNFDPGKVDIGSGTPDSENGIFEITGLATQFMQYGKYTTERTWTESDNTTTNPVITEDVERF
jgi:hypothetical protein